MNKNLRLIEVLTKKLMTGLLYSLVLFSLTIGLECIAFYLSTTTTITTGLENTLGAQSITAIL
jgi:hypothetical protein